MNSSYYRVFMANNFLRPFLQQVLLYGTMELADEVGTRPVFFVQGQERNLIAENFRLSQSVWMGCREMCCSGQSSGTT